MRRLLILALLLGALPAAFSSAAPQTSQITDAREPFAIELPEIGSGLLEGVKTTEVFIPPGKQITRLKIWLLNPYADRVTYSGLKASLNGKSLAIVAKPLSGTHGKLLDVNLREHPELQLMPGKNVVEVTAHERESGRTYRCSFVLLPGKDTSSTPVIETAVAEIRCEAILAPEDPGLPISDRQAPALTLLEPKTVITATSPEAFTVRVSGEASDNNGVISSVTVNGKLIAASPKPTPKKSNKKDKTPLPDPATIKLPFDQTVTIEPSQRVVLVEAKDLAGNRALCTIPILREAVANKGGFGGRKYAVLAGVSWYRHNEGGLNNLQFADADATAMRAWLRTPQGGDFKDEDIECLTNQNATLASLEAAINRFLTKAGENDLIYLFLAGHGAPDPYDKQNLYFLLHDSKVTDLPRTAFPMKKLGAFLTEQSKKARLIAFFDTCHSAGIKGQPIIPLPPGKAPAQGDRGVGTKGVGSKKSGPPALVTPPVAQPAPASSFNFYNAELFTQKGWTVLTSSGMTELSQESTRWGGGHGVFTWALLEGAQGKADTNGDCKITAGELANYVTATVSRETGKEQTPQSLPGGNHSLVIASAVGSNCKRVSVIPPIHEDKLVTQTNTVIRQTGQKTDAQTQVLSRIPYFLKSNEQQTAVTSQFESHTQVHMAKSRALLVGIDHYQNAPAVKPTRGAEADAIETKHFIKEKYGFGESDIHTLLGPQATAARIKQEFQTWLIRETQPGDRVFFLYAGHSSQTKDLNNDESDGLDEVLAPYDANWHGDGFVNVILDDELDELTLQLAGRLVVIVFDSCNSGTITRGVPGTKTKSNIEGDARYLPSPGEAQSLRISDDTRSGGQQPADYTVSDDRILTRNSGAATSQPREAQERDLKLVDVKTSGAAAGHVVISAAQSNQSAFSMVVGGKQRGALSLVFAEAQRDSFPTVRELRRTVAQRIAEIQQSGRLRGNQRPNIEASPTLEDQPLFAAKQSVPELAFANPQSKLQITLRSLEGRQRYKIGDKVSYEVSTNASGYLYVLVFSQHKIATCIFPDEKERDSRFPKGTYRLPSKDFFYAQDPVGKDVVVALLSTVPLNLSDKENMTWQEVFDRMRSKKLAGYVKAPSEKIEKTGAAVSLEVDWQGTSLVIETLHNSDQFNTLLSSLTPNYTNQAALPASTFPPLAITNLKESIWRKIADQYVAENRLEEAQQAIGKLKQEEFKRYFPPDEEESSASSPNPSTFAEAKQKELDKKLQAISDEQRDLLLKKVKTDKENSRLTELSRELVKVAEDFESLLNRIIKESGDQGKRVEERFRATEGLMPDLKDLGDGAVAVFTLVGKEKYSVILVTPNERVGGQYKIKASELERKVAEFRKKLQDPKQDPSNLAKELHQILLGPIAKHLEKAQAKTLMWSLDGVLRYLPIATLHDGKSYLVERYRNTVFTLTSYTRLKESLNQPWNVLGLGISKPVGTAPALPAVREELFGIISPNGNKMPKGLFPGKIVLDEAFTTDSLRLREKDGHSVVHIASHFNFQPGDKEKTFLLLGKAGLTLNLGEIAAFKSLFRGLQLLTLSACNTAMGSQEATGIEIESFAELAQKQGAKSVIATLWRVDDKSTAILMQKFYELRKLNPSFSKAEALQQAQLSLLSGKLNPFAAQKASQRASQAPKIDYKHPYYWGPFILIGHWK